MSKFLRWLALALFISSGAARCWATAIYYKYSEWDQLTDQTRTAYMAGAVDSLLMTVGAHDRMTELYFSDCLTRTKITAGQMARNVRAYASAHPALQTGTVQSALLDYLNEFCQPKR